MPSKEVLVIIPQTCEYVTSHEKMDFTDVIKTLEMRKVSQYVRGRQKVQSLTVHVIKEAEVSEMSFKDGERDHEPRNSGSL